MATTPTMAEIRGFGGNFAPRSWALCNGQLLSINQNQALFSLLGTTFGGDGRTTFALPDLRGRTPIGPGTGPGLTTRKLGQRSGEEIHYLTLNEMPSHKHNVNQGYDNTVDTHDPNNAYPGNVGQPVYGTSSNGNMAQATVGMTGGSQYHSNQQPYLTINWIICMQGLFPSRS